MSIQVSSNFFDRLDPSGSNGFSMLTQNGDESTSTRIEFYICFISLFATLISKEKKAFVFDWNIFERKIDENDGNKGTCQENKKN